MAKIISWAFHPLLIPTYLVVALGLFMPQFLLIAVVNVPAFVALVFIMSFVLPVANLLMFKAFGTLPSLQMQDRSERVVPFVLISIIYLVMVGLFFFKVSANVNFNKVMSIVAAMVLAGTVATFFEKVSIHSLAICGVMGILVPLNKAVENNSLVAPTVAVLVLAGLIMSSRLYLNAHTPRQVLFGAVLGFSVGFFGMTFLF